MALTTNTRAASPKQIAFIRKLAAERPTWTDALNGNTFERCFDATSDPSKFIGMTEASQVIEALLALPRASTPERPVLSADEVGCYVLPGGTILKAQPNKAKTNVYVMAWVPSGADRMVDADESHAHGDWVYEASAQDVMKRQIVEGTARKMTLDEAKAFILRYGKCVRCGRTLKAHESVERGIGPVCVKYFSF